MIAYRHIESKDLYVFTKRGTYWGLTPDELQEMHNLTGELLAEAPAGPPEEE